MLSQQVSGPTDTASLTYGNGYNICGPMTYSLINKVDDVVNESWIEFEFVSILNQADKLFFNVISEPEGTRHDESLRLKAELVDYPSALPAFIPIRLRYYGCFYD